MQRQAVAFFQHLIDFVNWPLPPAGRQAGTHGGEAGGFAGLAFGVALHLPAGEAAGLGREIVESAHQGVETLAEVGGVERGLSMDV